VRHCQHSDVDTVKGLANSPYAVLRCLSTGRSSIPIFKSALAENFCADDRSLDWQEILSR
jgi:hypothetical protein